MTSPFEMKTCSRCKQDLPETEFYPRADGTLYSYCKRCVDRRGLGYVYRVVGDTRPVFFEKSAPEKEHPPVGDDPEGDAWWASLQAEVAERKARRARMCW